MNTQMAFSLQKTKKNLGLLTCFFIVSSIFLTSSLASRRSFSKKNYSKKIRAVRSKLQTNKKKNRNKKLSLSWKTSLASKNYSDDFGSSIIVQGGIHGNLSYKFLSSFQSKLSVFGQLESGSTVSLLETNQAKNGVYLKEALIRWKAPAYFSLSAGAIDQSKLNTPLLTDKTFPGVVGKVSLKSQFLKSRLQLSAGEFVPTSTNLSTRSESQDGLPSFSRQMLKLSLRPHRSFKLSARVIHFNFKNLPEDIATESLLIGNTIRSVSETEKQFAFNFSGWAGGGDLLWKLSPKASLKFGTQIIQNTEAPSGVNIGQSYFVAGTYNLNNYIIVKPKFEYFFNEPDTSPAFYNSSTYGHNNHEGFIAELTLNFKKLGFNIKGQYIKRDILNFSDIQSNNQEIFIRWETNYGTI